jgi:tetratricopeptide (TPR) repeat protein
VEGLLDGMQLSHALFGFFWVRSHQGDWMQAGQIALEVARRTGDLAAQAQTQNDLGAGYYRQGRYDQALACLKEATDADQIRAASTVRPGRCTETT